MQRKAQTAVLPLEHLQAAYNEAVLSDRKRLAFELEQLWFAALETNKLEQNTTASAYRRGSFPDFRPAKKQENTHSAPIPN